MKRKIFNTLKHKLQWLVLLTALLGVSQGVWGDSNKIHGNFSGSWSDYVLDSNGEVTINISAGNYEFGIKYNNNNTWYAKNQTFTTSFTDWDFATGEANARLNTSVSGDYKFKVKDNNGKPRLSVTFPSSCSTPSNSDINITAPSSATTLYLGSGSAPSVTQTVTATCSKGNTYSWESNHPTYDYTSAFSPYSGTMTNVAFASSSSKSTTATFYHEGVYTTTFKAGCSNTTDANKNAPTITVKPGHLYFDGPFFSGSGYDLTKQHVEINTSTDKFEYEWTAAYTSGDFVISVGSACNDFASSAYTIGNYAEITATGVSMAGSGNHNFSPNIGTISVGDRLRLTVEYTGLNASNIPHYNVTLEKFCNGAPIQNIVDILDGTKVWFYAGILSSWNQSQIKCKLSSTDNGPYDLSSTEIDICTSTKAKIAAVNLPSANYCLHHPSWTDGCVNMGENAVGGKIYVIGKNFCDVGNTNGVQKKSGISLSNLKFDNGSGGTTKTVEKGTDVSIFAQSATTTNPWGNGLKIKYYVKKSGESTYYTECDWEASVANTTGTTGTLDTDNLSAGTYTVYALLMNATSEEEAVKASTTLTLTINSCDDVADGDFSVTNRTYTYDGSNHTATVTSSNTSTYNPSISVKYGSSTGSGMAASKKAAGSYHIYVTVDAADGKCAATDFHLTTSTKRLVINKVTPSSSNYSSLFSISGTGSHAYTGESQSVAIAWKSPYTACTGVITVKYDGSETAPINAGSYPVTISVASGTNNNASASDIEIGTLTITPIDQSTAVTISNSGTQCIPSAGGYVDISASGGNTSEAFTYSVDGTPSSGISLNTSTGRITANNAGSISVKATRPGGTNYNDKTSSSYTYTFVVTPTTITVTPSSAVEKVLPSSVAQPSVTQDITASHTGNSYAWTLLPNYSVNSIADASSANTTITFKREGVYTATAKGGCKNTTDVQGNSAAITVEPPLTIYLAGTLVSSAGDQFADNNFPMTRTSGSYVYTRRFDAVVGSAVTYTSRKFTLRESSSSSQSNYIIPKYAKVNYTNISTTGDNNDLYTTGITYSAGDKLEVRAEYKGYNSSENKPEWDISIGLVCDDPVAKTISISDASICNGSDVQVIVNSSQSGYIYIVYDSNNTQVGTATGDGSNKSITVTRPTASTTYTVKAKQAASCTPTAMSNTVSVTVNDRPTFSPSSGITQYLPVTVTSNAATPSWSIASKSPNVDAAWISNTSGTSTVLKAPTGTYTVSDGNCSTGNIVVSNDTETCD